MLNCISSSSSSSAHVPIPDQEKQRQRGEQSATAQFGGDFLEFEDICGIGRQGVIEDRRNRRIPHVKATFDSSSLESMINEEKKKIAIRLRDLADSNIPILRSTTFHGNYGRTSMAPRALLGRYFGKRCFERPGFDAFSSSDDMLASVDSAWEVVTRNPASAKDHIVHFPAWCVCEWGAPCGCSPPTNLEAMSEDPVYFTTRFVLSRMQRISHHHHGEGMEAFLARLVSVAYLPITRLYDAGVRKLSFRDACLLVNVDAVKTYDQMPNIRGIMEVIPFFHKPTKVIVETDITSILCKVFSKVAPLRCKVRSLDHTCEVYCLIMSEFCEFLLGIFRCGLFGMSPNCIASPSFHVIQCIDAIYPEYEDTMTNVEVAELVSCHNFILFKLLREFMCHVVSGMPEFHTVLCHTYQWHGFESRVRDIMSFMRQTLGVVFLTTPVHKATPGLLRPVEEITTTLNTDVPKSMYHPRQRPPSELLASFITSATGIDFIYNERIMKTPPRLTTVFLPALRQILVEHYGMSSEGAHLVFMEMVFRHQTGEFRDNMTALVSHYIREHHHHDDSSPQQQLPTCDRRCLATMIIDPSTRQWLTKSAPLSIDAARDIPNRGEFVQMTHTSECIEASRSDRILRILPVLSEEDLIRLFVFARDASISHMTFIPLPDEIKRMQLRALRHTYGIPEVSIHDPIISALAWKQYCMGCGTLLTFVGSNDRSDLSKEDGNYLGAKGVTFDRSGKCIECGTCSSGDHIIAVPTVGSVATINGDAHIVCCMCGSITIMDAMRNNGGVYSCQMCEEIMRIRERMSIIMTVPLCPIDLCRKRITKDAFCTGMDVRDDVCVHGRCTNGNPICPDGTCTCDPGTHRVRKCNISRTTAPMRSVIGITDCGGSTTTAGEGGEEEDGGVGEPMFADDMNRDGLRVCPQDPRFNIRRVGFCKKHFTAMRRHVVHRLRTMVSRGEKEDPTLDLPAHEQAVLPPRLSTIKRMMDESVEANLKRRSLGTNIGFIPNSIYKDMASRRGGKPLNLHASDDEDDDNASVVLVGTELTFATTTTTTTTATTLSEGTNINASKHERRQQKMKMKHRSLSTLTEEARKFVDQGRAGLRKNRPLGTTLPATSKRPRGTRVETTKVNPPPTTGRKRSKPLDK